MQSAAFTLQFIPCASELDLLDWNMAQTGIDLLFDTDLKWELVERVNW